MEVGQVLLQHFWSLMIDVAWVVIYPFMIFYSDLYPGSHSRNIFRKSIYEFFLVFNTLPCIIIQRIYQYFELVFQVEEFKLAIFRAFGQHISQRSVAGNVWVTRNSMSSRIIYECGF